MSEAIHVYSVNGVICPHCKVEFKKFVTVAHGRGGVLHKGMTTICSACLHPATLGDADWHPTTPAEFHALSESDQKLILTTAKGIEGLMQKGKEWTPYGATDRHDIPPK